MVTIDDKTGKIKRTLGIYTRLKNGNVINKIEEANKYGVNERSIQRDIDYLRAKDKTIVKRKLKPVAIMFSEYYFYLTAFVEDKKVRQHFETLDDSFPTIYRVDRIEKLKVLDERFHIPYSSRFEEGEFRKRIQFMYGGKLQKIKFKYSGNDIDSILDRLPTARILSEEDGKFIVSAEVFGKGIDMWIRSQGDLVEMMD